MDGPTQMAAAAVADVRRLTTTVCLDRWTDCWCGRGSGVLSPSLQSALNLRSESEVIQAAKAPPPPPYHPLFLSAPSPFLLL